MIAVVVVVVAAFLLTYFYTCSHRLRFATDWQKVSTHSLHDWPGDNPATARVRGNSRRSFNYNLHSVSVLVSLSVYVCSLQSTVYSLSQSLPTCRWRIPATILGKCVGVGAATKSNREPAARLQLVLRRHQRWAGQGQAGGREREEVESERERAKIN